jgi:hypothetical protein
MHVISIRERSMPKLGNLVFQLSDNSLQLVDQRVYLNDQRIC